MMKPGLRKDTVACDAEKGKKDCHDTVPNFFKKLGYEDDLSSTCDSPGVESVTYSRSGDFGSTTTDDEKSENDFEIEHPTTTSFLAFRLNFLFVTLVVMLADGLQGTHLYVLYESYGYSVASLYSIGFLAGALAAPIMGPIIDKCGRKKAALLYCALEAWINQLEQYPLLIGLVTSRVIGGITTNLLHVVFEAWVDTEYRIKKLPQEKYEIIMRDSLIVSNLAAIASGWLAHVLAETLGPVGPFEGAVTCTCIAFAVIFFLWNENYGRFGREDESNNLQEALTTFKQIKSDSRILRICIIQGLTLGSLQIVIFLWSPLLRDFAEGARLAGRIHWWGMDKDHAPAYGLIFGAYMAAGVVGGLVSSSIRKLLNYLFMPAPASDDVDGNNNRSVGLELLCAMSYFLCCALLLVPCFVNASSADAFSMSLAAFVMYEFMVGVYSPCEGTIRSIYIPNECRGSVMAIPTIIVNVAVAFGVISTEAVTKQTSLTCVALLLATAGCLQLTLVVEASGDNPTSWRIFQRIKSAYRSITVAPFVKVTSPQKSVRNDDIFSTDGDSTVKAD